MPDPSLRTRLRARLAGEVSVDALGAYRTAGAAAFSLYLSAEEQRATGALAGHETFALCTWNAFVLQTLGDAFVDADFAADPGTVGFLPPVTAEQALAFYDQVGWWLAAGRQAQDDPGHVLEIQLPVELPEWAQVEPCPDPHLHAMLSAGRVIVQHAELAVTDASPDDERVLGRLRGELAALQAAIEYAAELHAGAHTTAAAAGLHERIEVSVKDVVERGYGWGSGRRCPPWLIRPRRRAPGGRGDLPDRASRALTRGV